MEIRTWKAWKEVNMTTYMERLAKASRKNESILCVGLDPEPHRLPEHLRGLPAHEAILAFNKELIDATCDLVAAYKPNLAFYEALGPEGMETLRATVRHVPNGVPVIADAKRGDIDHTMRLYATAETLHSSVSRHADTSFMRHSGTVSSTTAGRSGNGWTGLPPPKPRPATNPQSSPHSPRVSSSGQSVPATALQCSWVSRPDWSDGSRSSSSP